MRIHVILFGFELGITTFRKAILRTLKPVPPLRGRIYKADVLATNAFVDQSAIGWGQFLGVTLTLQ
jgi:hypothetical protein